MFLIFYFTWLAFREARKNDQLIEEGPRRRDITRDAEVREAGDMPFTIIAENCTGCSACEQRCPTKAISGDPKKAYLIEPTMCIDCGACGGHLSRRRHP